MSGVTLSACSVPTSSQCSFRRNIAKITPVCWQRSSLQATTSQQRCLLASRQHAPSRRCAGRLICRAEGSELSQKFPPSTRVRVTQSITVWHAPKRKDGLDLKGMEGEVDNHVDMYKGKKLSTNLPVKVKFLIENDGKETKFFSHLAEEEFEAV